MIFSHIIMIHGDTSVLFAKFFPCKLHHLKEWDEIKKEKGEKINVGNPEIYIH